MTEENRIEKPDEDIYDAEQREVLKDEDAITPAEEAFVEGYENPNLLQCGDCGNTVDMETAIEKIIGEDTYWFCDEECLNAFLEKKGISEDE